MAGRGRDPGRSVTARVLAVLAAFDDSHPRLRLSEVARRSGLPVSTVSRLLAELVAGEALARRPDGRYEVGRRLWQLGLLAPLNQELREVALPFIHDIQTATGDVAHIAVREGIAALYVERVVGRSSYQEDLRVVVVGSGGLSHQLNGKRAGDGPVGRPYRFRR